MSDSLELGKGSAKVDVKGDEAELARMGTCAAYSPSKPPLIPRIQDISKN